MTFTESILLLLKEIAQIVLLAIPFYYLLKFFRRTRGYRVLFGILSLLLAMYLAAAVFHMDEIGWLLGQLATLLPIALIVIFQPELRRIFAEIGGRGGTRGVARPEDAANVVTQLAKAVTSLAGQRIGAIIAIEKDENLDPFAIGGRRLGAPVVAELLDTIFYPGTSLHDGGVIVRGGTIAYAGCIFPLGAVDERRRAFGTRHRAAIGLTERTDAVVLVVSEETGLISVAYRGDLVRGLGENSLVRILHSCVGAPGSDHETVRTISEARHDPGGDPGADRVAQAIADVKEDR